MGYAGDAVIGEAVHEAPVELRAVNAFFPDSSVEGSVGSTKRRTLLSFFALWATAPTRAPSPGQLPTNHDFAVPAYIHTKDKCPPL